MRLENLKAPSNPVDVVLDTDTFNEVDDQFALAYLLANEPRLHTRAIFAAPFVHPGKNAETCMEESYAEILRILEKANRTSLISSVYKGSRCFLENEETPVKSEAAEALCRLAASYSPEKPLYVVAIGAITNIASALLFDPSIADKIVIVWLGGHSHDFPETNEYNMAEDIAAARVVFKSCAPLVQLPCFGVVSDFSISYLEIEHFLRGKNPLSDFLADRFYGYIRKGLENGTVSRVIWDVTAVAWLLNENQFFMRSRTTARLLPDYDLHYVPDENGRLEEYVYLIHRDNLVNDLFRKLANNF